MRVQDGMNPDVLTIGPSHTLREASRLMAKRQVGAAVVADADGLGILTERDVLEAIGADQDPDVELVGDHLTKDLVFAAPDWNMDQAAAAMVRGGFRHLVVLEGNEVVGILAMRDIVRSWLAVPASLSSDVSRARSTPVPTASPGSRDWLEGCSRSTRARGSGTSRMRAVTKGRNRASRGSARTVCNAFRSPPVTTASSRDSNGRITSAAVSAALSNATLT